MIDKYSEKMDLNQEYFDNEYMECVCDLLNHEKVKALENYLQHGCTYRLRHCINVSYISYIICKRLRFDYLSAARGGLLHDFFLYDWHDSEGIHGITHPRVALQNSKEYFNLTKCEQDIIGKHMFPLTISPPKYRETCVIIIVDKYCAVREVINIKYIEILYSKIIR